MVFFKYGIIFIIKNTMPQKKVLYTKEQCKEIFSKCKNRTEFRSRHYGAFCRCEENGWLEEICPSFFDWDKPKTFEEAVERTKHYECRSDLWKDSHRLYYFLEKNGWLDNIDNLKVITEESNVHYVYAYEFPQYNTAYIGRTVSIRKRHLQHLRSESCSLDKFIHSKGIESLDMPRIIYEGLTAKESQEKEAEQIEEYKKNGWNVLNTAKAGSLGSTYYKYTRKVCYNLAKQFKTKKEFREAYRNVYFKCLEKGWIKDYDWLERTYRAKKTFTYEECKEAANRCNTRTEFRDKYRQMYLQSYKNGWLDDFINSKVIHNTIVQYDLTGHFLNCYDKIHQAFGKKADLINHVSKNEKHYAYGSFWFIIDDVLDANGNIKEKIDMNLVQLPKNLPKNLVN